jgi:hypothetical protein
LNKKQSSELFDSDYSHEYDRDLMKTWSSLSVFLVLALAGCGEGAKLLQEGEDGGVVVYPFIGEQGPMLSSFRTNALALMKEKCGGPYTVVQEGETKGRIRTVSPIEGAQETIQERRWGIQFQCK